MDTSDITTDAPTRPDAPPRSTGTHGGRRRIHRKLDLTSEPAALQPRSDPAELLVVFHDGHGVPSDSYDFASLGLPTDIAAVLSDAAKAILTPLEPQTRESYWKTFRNFSRFVLAAQPPINSVRDVNSKTFQDYRNWLLQQTHHRTDMPLVQRTIASHSTRLSQILSSGKLLPGNRLPCEIALPAYVMPNRTPTPPQRHLDEPQLKTLLSECYYEIRETRRLFSHPANPASDILSSNRCLKARSTMMSQRSSSIRRVYIRIVANKPIQIVEPAFQLHLPFNAVLRPSRFTTSLRTGAKPNRICDVRPPASAGRI